MSTIYLFVLLILLTLPGILLGVRPALRYAYSRRYPTQNSSPPTLLVLGLSLQLFLWSLVAITLGILINNHLGLDATPLLSALIHHKPTHGLAGILEHGLMLGIHAALLYTFLYYALLRHFLGDGVREAIEQRELVMGFIARLCYNGIVIEILFRWGLVSLLLFLFYVFSGTLYAQEIGSAILLAAVLFSASQLPALYVRAQRPSRRDLALISLIHTALGCLFGWLFVYYGLEAAIAAHIVFEAVCYPVDRVLHPFFKRFD